MATAYTQRVIQMLVALYVGADVLDRPVSLAERTDLKLAPDCAGLSRLPHTNSSRSATL